MRRPWLPAVRRVALNGESMKKLVTFKVVVSDSNQKDYEAILKEVGEQGWELATILDRTSCLHLVFQRVLMVEEPES